MEIKLQLREALNIHQILKFIIDDTQTKVDSLLKFRLLGFMKAIDPMVSNFDTIRNEKIMEYGEKTADGNYQILKENKEAIKNFNNDLAQVLDSEIAITANKLKAVDVFDKGINAEYLIGLYSIIEE